MDRKLICRVFAILFCVITAQTKSIHRREQTEPNFRVEKEVTPDYKVTWEVFLEDERISFTVEAKTVGWVGFGISNTESKKPSDVVIGGLKSGKPYFYDYYFTQFSISPRKDTTQNWESGDITEEDGSTLLKFSRPFDTGDAAQDVAIKDEELYIVWAYHPTDDLRNPESVSVADQHDESDQHRGSFQVNLLQDPNPRTDPPTTTPETTTPTTTPETTTPTTTPETTTPTTTPETTTPTTTPETTTPTTTPETTTPTTTPETTTPTTTPETTTPTTTPETTTPTTTPETTTPTTTPETTTPTTTPETTTPTTTPETTTPTTTPETTTPTTTPETTTPTTTPETTTPTTTPETTTPTTTPETTTPTTTPETTTPTTTPETTTPTTTPETTTPTTTPETTTPTTTPETTTPTTTPETTTPTTTPETTTPTTTPETTTPTTTPETTTPTTTPETTTPTTTPETTTPTTTPETTTPTTTPETTTPTTTPETTTPTTTPETTTPTTTPETTTPTTTPETTTPTTTPETTTPTTTPETTTPTTTPETTTPTTTPETTTPTTTPETTTPTTTPETTYPATTEPPPPFNGFTRTEVLSNDLEVTWTVNYDVTTVIFNVTAHTYGFVGFGFSDNGNMVDADLILGGVYEDGRPYFGDYYSTSDGAPLYDSQQNWLYISSAEQNSLTNLVFKRNFDTKDNQDLRIRDQWTYFIWLVGETDTLEYDFARKGSHPVNMLESRGSVPTTSPQPTTVDSDDSTPASAWNVSVTSIVIPFLLAIALLVGRV